MDACKLNTLMQQGFYRTEHLTLKDLATELELPEYKTRSLINQTLGYRNFNDYINQLRIHEAAERLKSEPDSPVLNISLDVGYRTLSSFNRAFKDIMSMSPSEYRSK
jgi:AraC-like DNA-binding protein